MEELIDCLETEEKEFERLLALSQQKTPIIVSNKIAELEKITDEEQVIVSRISNL
ncbi:MAG: flagellar export chaperone FlgN, partial [Lachnospiraceae bacterium]|nr:flagellar export chaperone FlgN [Lachnospiraceae bacterium]